jgi:glycyl-tRNA synthetase
MADVNDLSTSSRQANVMEKIVSLCKRRGFIFQSSEIYGGIGGIYDFGPLGAELKRNLRDEWWKKFVLSREDMVGMDSGIIMNAKVWKASGHTTAFTDPLVECKKCHLRFRADQLDDAGKCKEGGAHEFTEEKTFNILVKTHLGPVEDSSTLTYLRGETAQGIFVNFKNVLESSRLKLPFGIAQIGKAFRNEITPGNFIFRTREFEQGEIEFFINPNEEESAKWYDYWIDQVKGFYVDLGIKEENLAIVPHAKEKLSHYSIGTSDVEYKYPFGQSELAGVAQRTDYDLTQHQKFSGKSLEYFDEESGKKFIPYVVEPSMGIDRAALAFLCDAYDESDGTDGREAGEVTLHLSAKLAPFKCAVFPLVKKDGVGDKAREVYKTVKSCFPAFYDESGSIGRRYRRQDEIGTPFCVTVDYQTLEDQTVTIRERDSMKQERINISEITNYLFENIS